MTNNDIHMWFQKPLLTLEKVLHLHPNIITILQQKARTYDIHNQHQGTRRKMAQKTQYGDTDTLCQQDAKVK